MTPFEQALLEVLRWIAIGVVGILSAARISRLVTVDDWPPTVWLRIKWDTLTRDGAWSNLVHCPYCFAPYSWAFVLAWGIIFDWPTLWWIFNSWLAGAYVAAIVQANDGPRDDGE